MLNSGKNNSRFARQKKIIILSLVLSEKKILNETKNHNPPSLQVKWSVPKVCKLICEISLKLNEEDGTGPENKI